MLIDRLPLLHSPTPTVSGNTFKKLWPNRLQIGRGSTVEPGRRGAVFKVHPPPVLFLGVSSHRLAQRRAGQGSPLGQALASPRLIQGSVGGKQAWHVLWKPRPTQTPTRPEGVSGGTRSFDLTSFGKRSRHECGWFEKPRFSVSPCSLRERWVFGSLAPERRAGLKSTPGSTVLSLSGLYFLLGGGLGQPPS